MASNSMAVWATVNGPVGYGSFSDTFPVSPQGGLIFVSVVQSIASGPFQAFVEVLDGGNWVQVATITQNAPGTQTVTLPKLAAAVPQAVSARLHWQAGGLTTMVLAAVGQ